MRPLNLNNICIYVLACLFCQFGVGGLYSILVSLATQVQTKENIISSKVSLFSNKMTKKTYYTIGTETF